MFSVSDLDYVVRQSRVSSIAMPHSKLLSIDETVTARNLSRGRPRSDRSAEAVAAAPSEPGHGGGALVPVDQPGDGALVPVDAMPRGRTLLPKQSVRAAQEVTIRASMQDMTPDQVKDLVVSIQLRRQFSIDLFTKRRKEKERRKSNVEKLQKRIQELEQKQLQLVVPGRHPGLPKRRYQVTLPGQYHLAWKQTLGYGGVLPTLRILDCPVSRWSTNQ